MSDAETAITKRFNRQLAAVLIIFLVVVAGLVVFAIITGAQSMNRAAECRARGGVPVYGTCISRTVVIPIGGAR